MLRINAEGIVKNIFIVDDAIYFEDNRGLIVKHPCNRYHIGTDSYEATQSFLFNEEYLNLNDEDNIDEFKRYCINQYRNDIYSFIFKDVSITMDYVEDPVVEDEEVLMSILPEYCIK